MLWILLGAALTAALILVAARYCYRLVFYNLNDVPDDSLQIPPGVQYEAVRDEMRALVRSLLDIPYEQVYTESYDGLRLAARYYHFHDGAPVLIQFHGYRGNAMREFGGGYRIAKELKFNALVVDQRAHGESQGHTITFGILERYDCARWIAYVSRRFGADTKILLSGVSMGAATVLMASELQLPRNVIGIIADCPYSTPGAIIRRVCKDVRIPGWLAYPFIALGGWLFGGFKLWAASAVEAVKCTDIPILLIHGEDDRLVPSQMSRQIYQACHGPKQLFSVANAGHGLSFLLDAQGYTQAVRDFWNQSKGKDEQ